MHTKLQLTVVSLCLGRPGHFQPGLLQTLGSAMQLCGQGLHDLWPLVTSDHSSCYNMVTEGPAFSFDRRKLGSKMLLSRVIENGIQVFWLSM